MMNLLHEEPPRYLLHLPCRAEAHLTIYLQTGEIDRVDKQTDTLTEEQVLKDWPSFEQSDRAELKQYVEEKVFRRVRLSTLPDTVAIVDGKWVRKCKRMPDGSLKAKSRLCARGFLDPPKQELPTRSTMLE